MLFCSQEFLVFFCVVFAVYWTLPQAQLRIYLLLWASLYFYASWDRRLAMLIAGSTIMDYWIARGMEASSSPRGRRGLLLSVFLLAVLHALLELADTGAQRARNARQPMSKQQQCDQQHHQQRDRTFEHGKRHWEHSYHLS